MTLSGTVSDLDKDGLFGLITADDGDLLLFNLWDTAIGLRDRFEIGTQVRFIRLAPTRIARAVELIPQTGIPMRSTGAENGNKASAQGRPTLHGAHLRTLEALFRHPPAHNLEWMDVVALIEKLGTVQEKGNNRFSFDVGGEHHLMHKPHTKDLTSSDVVDLRHFLQRAGWSPAGSSGAASLRDPAAPSLMVVVDHHGAKVYRIDTAAGDPSKREITPYDPHHFLHHLTHKEQSREAGQRAPEDADFYKRIADALAAGGRIVVVGHGIGKSNASQYLTQYLRSHHPETYQRVVREIEADLSSATTAQLLVLAEQALPH